MVSLCSSRSARDGGLSPLNTRHRTAYTVHPPLKGGGGVRSVWSTGCTLGVRCEGNERGNTSRVYGVYAPGVRSRGCTLFMSTPYVKLPPFHSLLRQAKAGSELVPSAPRRLPGRAMRGLCVTDLSPCQPKRGRNGSPVEALPMKLNMGPGSPCCLLCSGQAAGAGSTTPAKCPLRAGVYHPENTAPGRLRPLGAPRERLPKDSEYVRKR